MKPLVGVDVSSTGVRAISVMRWSGTPLKRLEIKWDVNEPEAGVALLQKTFGPVSAIGIAVGLELLSLKHIQLPPVPSEERRRMILLEPDRFFPARAQLAISVSPRSDLVFAADAAMIERLVAAFEQWGPVESVEAGPVAFSRALLKDGRISGDFEMAAGKEETGYARIEGGELLSARRAFGDIGDQKTRSAPAVRGVPSEFLSAFGSALGADGRAVETLAGDRHAAVMARRRLRRLLTLSLAAAIACVLAIFSYDRARAGYLERIETRLAELAPEADVSTQARARLADRESAMRVASQVKTSHADPLAILALLGRKLPPDAFVASVRVAGDEWEVDGTAGDASAIVPALDVDGRIENVHLRSATSRFRDAGKTRETFSIGFRARHQP